jgi:8-oxo-dGTP pyrophosphatase MutT (NUDIX family)
MSHQLTFDIRYKYDSIASGITVEVLLRLGQNIAVTHGKVDPGAQICLFQRELAEELGINVESGHRFEVRTLTGSLTVYGHTVTMQTLGLEFDSVVYFAADYGLPRSLLGREGWLQKVRMAVVDYETTLYLSPYQE